MKVKGCIVTTKCAQPCLLPCSCYVLVMPRRFPPPWSIVPAQGGWCVMDASGQPVAYTYGDDRSQGVGSRQMTTNEARRMGSYWRTTNTTTQIANIDGRRFGKITVTGSQNAACSHSQRRQARIRNRVGLPTPDMLISCCAANRGGSSLMTVSTAFRLGHWIRYQRAVGSNPTAPTNATSL
jgi:hypothetical protein